MQRRPDFFPASSQLRCKLTLGRLLIILLQGGIRRQWIQKVRIKRKPRLFVDTGGKLFLCVDQTVKGIEQVYAHHNRTGVDIHMPVLVHRTHFVQLLYGLFM